ncbi:hypothetical protein THMIRHAS_16910 [Thiosulfatimonas sediminis]|uniref:Integrating conjugative element protein n=1 Tax=Thiosulfatimonas sediminis TaxID=2675054 RepID=A0A6F8PWD7_9GAMM|nr:integrating conjugative element protein [Thiosulfatimonas sediminis]BBP46318.1 hypothetical protein THMIRHAS_16910 [Thiosulfatimonas sediminis]
MRIKFLVVLILSLALPAQANELAKMVESMLPFNTSATPGVFSDYQVDFGESVPIDKSHSRCVIGYDKVSFSWLEQRKDALLQYRAVCYLANVQSLAEIDALRNAAYPVQVEPVNAQALVSIYRIKHYPALINSNWVYQ